MAPGDDAWLWGWDPTPGIVSVWAEPDGRVHVWRRLDGALRHEQVRTRAWMLVADVDGLPTGLERRELEGPGELRHLLRAPTQAQLTQAVLRAASQRAGHAVTHLRDLGTRVLSLPPEEQYLVATGRAYFRGLGYDDVRRLHVDLETTGLDPARERIFLIAVRAPDGAVHLLEGDDEAQLLRRFVALVEAADPDVIENHNLHGFDWPFLEARAQLLGVPLALGRLAVPSRRRGSGARRARGSFGRASIPGRELLDSMDAVLRHDFAARDLPGHGLKAVARHLGVAGPSRVHIRGDLIYEVYQRDPDRVRAYARADVEEAAAVGRLLGGAAFALAQMAPRRYERLADAGPATGIIDPMLVRAYLHEGQALPMHTSGDGTPHAGAALHLFAVGVARRVVKADVASLYPSLMRAHRLGPARDRLGVLLALVDRLVELRLAAKADGKRAAPGSGVRHAHEAMSAAMKLVVNSAYGYLAAGALTRFSDVHAANEVTRHGRQTLATMCHAFAARGATLLEADTDGVYLAVPDHWDATAERAVVTEVAALLPPLVQLEFDGRYAAMLSHEPKNYALLGYDKTLTLRGVAFRSRRAEPYGEAFLRQVIRALFDDDLMGVRAIYHAAVAALRQRTVPTLEVTSLVRLSKSPAEVAASGRRELPYEAMRAAGRLAWEVGTRVRVYRTEGGGAGLVDLPEDDEPMPEGPRDYDVAYYVRLLRDTFASRIARALAPETFAAIFADPDQLDLFAAPLADARAILTVIASPPEPSG